MPRSLDAAARRLQRAKATLDAKALEARERSRVPRTRLDVRRAGEPMPEWDKRPTDIWTLIDLSGVAE